MADTVLVYIADAHPLLWHLIGDAKLSAAARTALDKVDTGDATLLIPAVLLAELAMVVEKGRLPISPDVFTSAVARWQKATNVHLTNLTPDLVLRSRSLTAIPDIFDRLIVAEALSLGVSVITRDPIIVDSKLVPVIW